MKKYLILLTLTVLASCTKEMSDILRPATDGHYIMTVQAAKVGTKALGLSGSTLNATWTMGDVVKVYKGVDEIGELTAQSSGATTTLRGSVTTAPSADDVLTLNYLGPDNYGSQTGTLAHLATNCDYATATVTVTNYNDGIITTSAANFVNQQAIVKFILKDKSNNSLNASNLTISAASNRLVSGLVYNVKSHHSGYTYDGGTTSSHDDPSKFVDGKFTEWNHSKWCTNVGDKVDGIWYCEFHTSKAVQVDGYTLTTADDNAWYRYRNPKNWLLKAKLNSSDAWTTIATVTNDGVLEDHTYTSYDFNADVPGTYQYFRFEVSENQGDSVMQIEEIRLFHLTGSKEYGDLTITPASATSELFVAIRNENGMADTYTLIARVGGTICFFNKPSVTFTNGQYYEITVKMTEAEYVNLGLTSGTKWAKYNIGATKPEEYGNHYAWGETETKNVFNWDNYTHGSGSFSKYNDVDNKNVLDPEDDAATHNWGINWRTPTDAEWTELREQCTWTWEENYNDTGVNGILVTGPNSNSIFLPAAGNHYGSGADPAGTYGNYWTSSINTGDLSRAWRVMFHSSAFNRNDDGRYVGQTIRPVLAQ